MTSGRFGNLPRDLVPRVLFLIGDSDAHALWRSLWVAWALSARGYVADCCKLSEFAGLEGALESGRYNVIVTPRMCFQESAKQIPTMRQFVRDDRLVWIYELDDDILSPAIIDHQLAVFDVAREAGYDRVEHERQQRLAILQVVDGVIVSTEALRQIAERYTDAPVRVVPNAVDTVWLTGCMQGVNRQLPSPTIGWGGGARRAADLDPVAEAWRRIARRHREVTFVVFGERLPVLMDAIPKNEHRRVFIPWVGIETYARGLPHIDIACCSVADTGWNACKSPDKFYEHTVAGAPCVVSPALYGQVVRDGETALVAETADEWEAALERLLAEPELRWQLNAAALVDVARQHSIQATWWRWLEALTDLLEYKRAQSNGRSALRQYHAEPVTT